MSDSVRSGNSESKSDKLIIQHDFSTKYDCKTLEEFIGIPNMNIIDYSEDFKTTIERFMKVSKSTSENESSLEFNTHLKKFNPQIIFTGNKKDGEFAQVFCGKQPDFTWSITEQFHPWDIVTIIEKTKGAFSRNEISQMLEYLRMIVANISSTKICSWMLNELSKILYLVKHQYQMINFLMKYLHRAKLLKNIGNFFIAIQLI